MQKNQFGFNSHTHNFWPIYNAILRFYPVGIRRGEHSIYFDYPGIKELDKLVVETIHMKNELYKSWHEFEKRLTAHYRLEVRGTTYGQAPSLSTDLIIEETESDQFRRVKKISVALSLVGQFFTIYGIDENTLIEKTEGSYDLNYHVINAVTVSPHQEFKSYFEQLKAMVEESYQGYRFVPFALHDSFVNGLQVRYLDHEECTVFHALFNHLQDNIPPGVIRGDRYYGFEEWRVDDAGHRTVEIGITPPPKKM